MAVKNGRPPRPIDPEMVEEKLAEGLQIQTVAGLVGLTRQAFDIRRKQSEELDAAVRRGLARQHEAVDLALIEGIRGGNATLLIWYDKTRRGYQEKAVDHVVGLSPEDLLNAMEAAGLSSDQIGRVRQALEGIGGESEAI